MITAFVILWIIATIACIFWSACCSGTEMGCYSVNRVRLDVRTSRKAPIDHAARTLYRELQRPDRNLVTLLISNNIANYLAAVCATAACLTAGLSKEATTIISASILVPTTLILGEAVPKELFRANADRLIYAMARPLQWSRLALTYIGIHPLVRGVARLAEHATNLRPDAVSDTRQRVKLLIREGLGSGILSSSQASLADRALAFGRVTVNDEMTPWALVRTLPISADSNTAIRVASLSRHSRLPMIDANGNVVGLLRAMDIFIHKGVAPSSLAQPVLRIKAMTTARNTLMLLRDSDIGAAIVEDDNGKPLGIVTAKDLVEPLTGDLPDP